MPRRRAPSSRGSAERTVGSSRGAAARCASPSAPRRATALPFRFAATQRPRRRRGARRAPDAAGLHPRAYTVAGVLRDTATVEFDLPADIDPGALDAPAEPRHHRCSPDPRRARAAARLSRTDCTEQITSAAEPLVALLRGRRRARGVGCPCARGHGPSWPGACTLSRRQRSDGGIGYWSRHRLDHALAQRLRGRVLLDARPPASRSTTPCWRGSACTSSARSRKATGSMCRWRAGTTRAAVRLSDRVPRSDFLSRAGRATGPRRTSCCGWRRSSPGRTACGSPRCWRAAATGSRRAGCSSPPGRRCGSRAGPRPCRRRRSGTSTSPRRSGPPPGSCSATLAVDPAHPLVGPLVETLVPQGRGATVVVEHPGLRDRRRRAGRIPAHAAGRGRTRHRGCSRGSRTVLSAAAVGACERLATVACAGWSSSGTAGSRLRLRLRSAGREERRAAGVLLPHRDRGASRRAGPARRQRASRSSGGTSGSATGSRSRRSPRASWCGCGSGSRLRATATSWCSTTRCPPGSRRWTSACAPRGGFRAPAPPIPRPRSPRGPVTARSRTPGRTAAGTRDGGRPSTIARSATTRRLRRPRMLWNGDVHGELPRARDHAGRRSCGRRRTPRRCTTRRSSAERRRGVHRDAEAAPRDALAPAAPRRWRSVRVARRRPGSPRRCRRRLLDAGGARRRRSLDRAGLPLRTTRAGDGSAARAGCRSTEIDPDLLAAFVAVEDRRFYEHRGVDPRAVARAARDDCARAGSSPARPRSPCSSRGCCARPAATWWGKVAQALWALRLERHLDKQAILEQYLNRVPLGQGTVGVEAAALALLRRVRRGAEPGPGGAARRARARAVGRQPAGVARRARGAARGRAQPAGRRRATPRGRRPRAPEPSRSLARAGRRAFLAPHFTTRVLGGWTGARRRRRPAPLRTSLDLPLQGALEAEVRHTVETPRAIAGARRPPSWCSTTPPARSSPGSARPTSGPTRAGQVDMVVSPRQPGSALKPFLYGARLRPRLHARLDASRHRARVPDRDRPVPSAQLRPPLPRAGARARGAGELVQRPRGRAGRAARRRAACCTCSAAGFASLGRRRRALRARARARQRRRDPARAGERLSRARQRWRVAARGAGAPARPGEPPSPAAP